MQKLLNQDFKNMAGIKLLPTYDLQGTVAGVIKYSIYSIVCYLQDESLGQYL